jgi:FixJ family two-component response regulator
VRAYASAEGLLADERLPERGCLVVDFNLPRIDGLALIDGLRRRGVGLPAILITSNPSPATRERAEDDGIVVIEKPLLGPALGEAIDRALRARLA